ncbi:MAG: DUF3159 domain-containing protein [Dermatophilaceae bacterium]
MAEVVGGAGQFVTVEELLRARLTTAFGGWRGAVESAVPTIAFVVVWTVTEQVNPAAIAAVATAVAFAAVRLVQGQTLRYLLWAVIGVVIAAVIATRTGRAQDAFLPGMIQTAATGLLFLVSNLVRWPVLGFLIAAGDPELAATSARVRAAGSRQGRADRAALSAIEREAVAAADDADVSAMNESLTAWRRHSGIVRVASRLGWVLAALSAIRLAVMVPLYLSEQVAALGISKIVLGWPAYLAAVLVMALMLLRGHTPLDTPAPSQG